MNERSDKIQPAVKKETGRVATLVAIETAVMWIVFAVLHILLPESVPFDYTVILGGICGALIAVLNFFLMGLMVQRVAASVDEDKGKTKVKASYTQRLLLQMLWVVVAILAPCFQFIAGILPLFFPSFGIKLTGILKKQ